MERLELLGQQLAKDLDREATGLPESQCIGPARLELLVSGTLDDDSRASVETHLGDCLLCLNNFVVMRDCLHGLMAPQDVSLRLAGRLAELNRQQKHPSPRPSVVEVILRPFTARIAAGWAVAVTAAAVLVISIIVPTFQRAMSPSSRDLPSVSPARPMRELSQRPDQGIPKTVSGVITHVQDATHGAVEAHVVILRDSAGAQYSIFVWGPLTAREGDAVQVDGVFQEIKDTSGTVTYKGVANVVRPARPR